MVVTDGVAATEYPTLSFNDLPGDQEYVLDPCAVKATVTPLQMVTEDGLILTGAEQGDILRIR